METQHYWLIRLTIKFNFKLGFDFQPNPHQSHYLRQTSLAALKHELLHHLFTPLIFHRANNTDLLNTFQSVGQMSSHLLGHVNMQDICTHCYQYRELEGSSLFWWWCDGFGNLCTIRGMVFDYKPNLCFFFFFFNRSEWPRLAMGAQLRF